MKTNLTYTIISLFTLMSIKAQDVLVKNDSSRIQAVILEIDPTHIKYKLHNYTDGPYIQASKTDIAYVIYKNGLVEKFGNQKQQQYASYYNSPKQHVLTPEEKDKKCEKLYKRENYLGFNYIAFLNNCLGFNYIRDFKKINLMINIPFAIGIGRPEITNNLYGGNYVMSYGSFRYNNIKYQIGINPFFTPNMKREVNFLIGPSLNYTAFDVTSELPYSQYDATTGYTTVKTHTSNFTIHRKHYGVSVGFLARITENFNMNMLFTMGGKEDSYSKKDPFGEEHIKNMNGSTYSDPYVSRYTGPYVNFLWSVGYRF